MTKGIVYVLFGITIAEIVSFQLGNGWFLPVNAAAILTCLIAINSRLRAIEQYRLGTEKASEEKTSEPVQADDSAVTRMEDIFPYSRHDRTNPFD